MAVSKSFNFQQPHLIPVDLTRIGITLGDPAGIGYEITARALASGAFKREDIVLFGSRRHYLSAAERCVAGLNADVFTFRDIPSGDVEPGRPGIESGRVAVRSIEQAVSAALHGEISGICTAPISKEAILKAGSRHIDHTTMLEALTGSHDVTTLFETGRLRTIFLTKHLPLREAINMVTRENIRRHIVLADEALKHLGEGRRRIAVAALNPHAGENGILGREEIDEIAPAVSDARAEFSVEGPVPADSVYHMAAEGIFDIVVSLYHDQGHIAAKTLDFRHTVSMNIGLPFLRTSVDHGTAFDIAGKGIADHSSMMHAIHACFRYCKTYASYRRSLAES